MKSEIERILDKTDLNPLLPRIKRKSEEVLYSTLVVCMKIAELAIRKKSEREALDSILHKLPPLPGQVKTYIRSYSDVYQRVCRVVFHGDEHHANMYRYANALRVAAKKGIKSNGLLEELQEGGVTKLFNARHLKGDEISTRWLRLDRVIVHKKKEIVVLRLKRREDNYYEVLS